MKTIHLLLTLLTCMDMFPVAGQGGVDVKYIPIASVDSSYVNRAVKIDFKPYGANGDADGRRYHHGDSIRLMLDDGPIDVVERKGRGTDHYYFRDEYLESKTYDPKLLTRIYTCIIKEIKHDQILFELTIQLYGKSRLKSLAKISEGNKDVWDHHYLHTTVMSEVKSKVKEIWISKDALDGILVRKNKVK